MKKMIIASHSTLAQGFKETLGFLTGLNEQIYTVCAYTDEDAGSLDSVVDNLLNDKDEFYILTDMAGGSVNQKFYSYISENIHVISGMNLPLAISIALQLANEYIDIDFLVKEARQQIVYLNQQNNEVGKEDE